MAMQSDMHVGSYKVDFGQKLGEGGFGEVYIGENTAGKTVAIKCCNFKTDEHGNLAIKELFKLQNIRKHKNIVELLDFKYANNSLWIAVELCNAGDLKKHLEKNTVEWDLKLDIMQQSAEGVAFLHNLPNPIVHRDIKPANILLHKEEPSIYTVKIADLGISQIIDPMSDVTTQMAVTDQKKGTLGFMAPEFFTPTAQYTRAVDVFAMALVYLMVVDFDSKIPIPLSVSAKKNEVLIPVGQEMAVHSKHVDITEILDGDGTQLIAVKKLMNRMIAFDRKDRPSMETVAKELKQIQGNHSASKENISTSKVTQTAQDSEPLVDKSPLENNEASVDQPNIIQFRNLIAQRQSVGKKKQAESDQKQAFHPSKLKMAFTKKTSPVAEVGPSAEKPRKFQFFKSRPTTPKQSQSPENDPQNAQPKKFQFSRVRPSIPKDSPMVEKDPPVVRPRKFQFAKDRPAHSPLKENDGPLDRPRRFQFSNSFSSERK